MRSLIVTGDDFGFSRGVNRAILDAHENGILTHASLMITGRAAAEAIVLARHSPSLRVGLHLVILDGRAALPPGQIPDLVDSSGRFRDDPFSAGVLYQFSRRARRQLEREIREQLARFRDAGLNLSHVDGHHHMHLHPVVLEILASLTAEFAIPRVRLPSEEIALALDLDGANALDKVLWSVIFAGLRRHASRRLRRLPRLAGALPQRVYGLLATGMVSEDYLLRLIPRIEADFAEIYCHPALELPGEPLNGPAGSGPRELAALLSPSAREALARAGFFPERPQDRAAASVS